MTLSIENLKKKQNSQTFYRLIKKKYNLNNIPKSVFFNLSDYKKDNK